MKSTIIGIIVFLLALGITIGIALLIEKSKTSILNIPVPPKIVPDKHRTFYNCVAATGSNSYKIVDDWQGIDLIPESGKGWKYFTDYDPTHGSMYYGEWKSLMRPFTDGSLRIDVEGDIKKYSQIRKAIRLYTDKTYNEGLFIMSANHIPAGMSVWPSWWLNGKVSENVKWACYGEIDIIEGVNSYSPETSSNASTLHTNHQPGGKPCDQSKAKLFNGAKLKQAGGGNCEFGRGGNEDYACGCDGKSVCPYGGCGVDYNNPVSFGWGFNQNGGGVYACELNKEGAITIWFFPNGSIPCDIVENKPNPDTWNEHLVVQFDPCPGQFKDLQMVINTALCGDWAGGVYDDGSGLKQKMGNSYNSQQQCKYNVQNVNNKMENAYWWINYIKVFQKNLVK